MKLSKNKIEAILNCTPEKDRLSYYFPLLKYNSRWKELEVEDFKYDYTSTDSLSYWIKNDLAMYNTVAKIAKDNNIPFINYSSEEKLSEINFEFANDMFNNGHCNIWGSDKVSYDFADFLNDNYQLPDRREESDYINWQQGYEEYIKVESEK